MGVSSQVDASLPATRARGCKKLTASVVPEAIVFPAQKDGMTACDLSEGGWLVAKSGEVLIPID